MPMSYFMRNSCCNNSGATDPSNNDAWADGKPDPDGQASAATMQEHLEDCQPRGVGHMKPDGDSHGAIGQAGAPTATPNVRCPDSGTRQRGRKKKTFKQFEEGTQPPYTGDEDVSNGLECFLCGAGSSKFTDWHKLSRHLTDKHGMRRRHLAGTKLGEISKAQRANNRGTENKRPRLTAGEHNVDQTEHQGSLVPLYTDVAEAAPSGTSCHQWKSMRVLVRCDATGEPLWPVEYGGIADGGGFCGGDIVSSQHVAHDDSLSCPGACHEGLAVARRPGSQHSSGPRHATGEVLTMHVGLPTSPDNMEDSEAHSVSLGCDSQVVELASAHCGLEVAARSSSMPAANDTLALVQTCPSPSALEKAPCTQRVATRLDRASRIAVHKRVGGAALWHSQLLHVEVKEDYKTAAAPEPSPHRRGARCEYPPHLRKDRVPLCDFKEWLLSSYNAEGPRASALELGAGRVMGMLTFAHRDASSRPTQPHETLALVSLAASGRQQELLNIPILSSIYSWTQACLYGMAAYCAYHGSMLKRFSHRRHNRKGLCLQDHASVLDKFARYLKTRTAKKARDHRMAIRSRAHAIDIKVLKAWPNLEDLQNAVLEGYMTLLLVADKFAGSADMPPAARDAANAAMAGGIHYDTLVGRKERLCL